MQKKNLFMKISSWIFIVFGIIELGGILVLWTKGGTALNDFFESIFVENKQSEVLFLLIVLVRVMIGFFCLMEIRYDLCISLAFLLIIKDFVFMYFFYITNVYMFLYRSIPEFLLMVIYMLGMIHFKFRET